MIIWGALWFSILALLIGLGDWFFDGFASILVYPMFGAVAGLHLRSVVQAEVKRQQVTQQTTSQVSPSIFAQTLPSGAMPESDSPLTSPRNAAAQASAAEAYAPPISHSEGNTNSYLSTSAVVTAVEAHNTSTAPQRYAPPVLQTQPTANPVATEPATPNLIEQAFAAAKGWLFGGNTVVRVGVVVLFIGLAFLAKYTAQLGLFPIQARLSVVAAAGLSLLIVGFLVRAKDGVRQYSLTLQGAGIAVLYLTILAAMRMYGLLPMPVAFALMAIICALGAVLAYMQNGLVLALCSFAGGFAAPILLSTGSDNYIGLFSYYTILNLAILGIAYFKAWRPLNLLGFFATFGVATYWGILQFQPENYLPSQLFLALFFAIYVVTAILYARNSLALPNSTGKVLVDSTLIFGTPLVAFGLQMGLVRDVSFGEAYSALAFALIYVLAAAVLVRGKVSSYRVLIECFIALGVVFLTLAVPLALDGQAIGLTWALEGLGAFWVGLRQSRWVPRAFGVLLQGLAFVALWIAPPLTAVTPFANIIFIGLLMLAGSALLLSYWLRNELPHSGTRFAVSYASMEKHWANPLYLYGFVMALWAFGSQVVLSSVDVTNYDRSWWIGEPLLRIYLLAAVFLIATFASTWLGRRVNQAMADAPILGVLPVLVVTLLLVLVKTHALFRWGWAFWPLALLMHIVLLRRAEFSSESPVMLRSSSWQHLGHAAAVWLMCALMADGIWQLILAQGLTETAWATVASLVSATLVLVALVFWVSNPHNTRWPLTPHRLAYLWTAALPLVVIVFVGAMFCALASSGQTAPLPYIPLLNPTDLSVALALAALLFWYVRMGAFKSIELARTHLLALLAGAAFVLINTIWLRVAHHFFGVDWTVSALFNSFIVQTGYAILWSVLALVLMVFAHRRGLRTVWMVGAALLGLTVVKLVFIDLANRGGFERIVAFISVGVMMLLIGYLAPLPPVEKHQEKSS
jgi:uncharacterized membrane protein